jgi:hypothetical protein
MNSSALVPPPKEKPSPGVMARRHITSEPSTSDIGLRAPAASVAAVAIRVNGERSRRLKHAGGLVDLPAGEHHCLNRAGADAAARMELPIILDLRA